MDIKICGIRRAEDVEFVNRYKPEYIGYVFAKSRRRVTAEQAAELTKRLAEGIKTVGVFVNEEADTVCKTAAAAGLDVIQLHGDEDEEYIRSLRNITSAEIWKAVRVKNGDAVGYIDGADRILLDKYSEAEYGGGGEAFDWLGGIHIQTDQPIMLAGGLNKENVLTGIRIFMPAGVDVSSGVETDGFKDEKKIREFIEKIRGEQNYEQNR